jgi:flotillin
MLEGQSMLYILGAVLVAIFIVIPMIVTSFLRSVEAGTIRLVTRWGGSTTIYRGPGKAFEIPLLTTGTTISSKAINVDLDITDQTADVDAKGVPAPIKVRVLASAIVSVGDSDTLIQVAANRFFSKPEAEQLNILIDLLSSSGRRAVNLLTHDQLFSAKSTAAPVLTAPALVAPAPTAIQARVAEDDGDPLAIIIRKACSRELTDLGLVFNSLNIKVVMSEVAEARRRMSAAEAQANADIVAAQQARRSREAQLEAERAISDSQRGLEQTKASNAALIAEAEILKNQAMEIAESKRRERASEAAAGADIIAAQQTQRAKQAQLAAERVVSDSQRELEQTRASNAALVAQAEAKRQDALALQREAELKATQIAQARADAERVKIEAEAQAEAQATRIREIAEANAESIRKVNQAIMEGGEAYLRYRQIEMVPQITPHIANALAQAKLVTISGGSGTDSAATQTTNQVSQVIQTMLAAQLVSKGGVLEGASPAHSNGNTSQ